jgi:hypothetical protein
MDRNHIQDCKTQLGNIALLFGGDVKIVQFVCAFVNRETWTFDSNKDAELFKAICLTPAGEYQGIVADMAAWAGAATADVANVQNVMQQVVARWDTLTTDERNFYDHMVNAVDPADSARSLRISDIAANPALIASSRYNIKKHNDFNPGMGQGGSPNVAVLFPTDNRVIHHTAHATSPNKAAANLANLCATAFSGGGPTAVQINGHYGGNFITTPLTVGLSRGGIQQLLKAAAQVNRGTAVVPTANVYTDADNVIHREVVNGELKFYKVDASGNRSNYNNADSTPGGLSCYGIGAGQGTCNHIVNCLQNGGTDLNACIGAMQAQDYRVTREQIKNIHPQLLFQLLKSLGFRRLRATDPIANGNLIKVQPADSWKAVTLPRWHGNAANNVSQGLMNFLEIAVEWVNANPAVLNKNYSGSSAEAAGTAMRPSYAAKLQLQIAPSADIAHSDYTSVLAGLRRPNAPSFGIPGLPQQMLMANRGLSGYGTQFGGSIDVDNMLHASNSKYMGADLLESVLEGILSDLNRANKQLDAGSEQSLRGKLNTLKDNQSQLIKSLAVMNRYTTLLEIVGPYSDDASVVSTSHMDKFQQNYLRLLNSQNSREQQLVSVLDEIKRLINPQAAAVDNAGINGVLPNNV